jgi:hypothetical protein
MIGIDSLLPVQSRDCCDRVRENPCQSPHIEYPTYVLTIFGGYSMSSKLSRVGHG